MRFLFYRAAPFTRRHRFTLFLEFENERTLSVYPVNNPYVKFSFPN